MTIPDPLSSTSATVARDVRVPEERETPSASTERTREQRRVFAGVTWGGQRSEHLQILLSVQQLQHTHTGYTHAHRSHTHTHALVTHTNTGHTPVTHTYTGHTHTCTLVSHGHTHAHRSHTHTHSIITWTMDGGRLPWWSRCRGLGCCRGWSHTHTHTHVYPGEVDVESWDAAEAGHTHWSHTHTRLPWWSRCRVLGCCRGRSHTLVTHTHMFTLVKSMSRPGMLPRLVTHTHTHTHVYPGEVDVESWDAAEAGHTHWSHTHTCLPWWSRCRGLGCCRGRSHTHTLVTHTHTHTHTRLPWWSRCRVLGCCRGRSHTHTGHTHTHTRLPWWSRCRGLGCCRGRSHTHTHTGHTHTHTHVYPGEVDVESWDAAEAGHTHTHTHVTHTGHTHTHTHTGHTHTHTHTRLPWWSRCRGLGCCRGRSQTHRSHTHVYPGEVDVESWDAAEAGHTHTHTLVTHTHTHTFTLVKSMSSPGMLPRPVTHTHTHTLVTHTHTHTHTFTLVKSMSSPGMLPRPVTNTQVTHTHTHTHTFTLVKSMSSPGMLPRPVTHTHWSHTHTHTRLPWWSRCRVLGCCRGRSHTHTGHTHTHTHTHVYPGEVDVESWDAAEAGHGVLRWNHSKGGKTAEVLVAFVEELELVRLSAGHPHSQSVQNTVHVCVREAHLRQRLSHSQRLTNTTTQRNRTLLINVPCTKCFSQYIYVLQISKSFFI